MSGERDHIRLRGLRTEGIHGVLASEKLAPQPFVVDVDLEVDLSVSGGSDDLADTVSYAEVADDVVAVVRTSSVDLIEHLADRIVAVCLRHDAVEAVTVTLHKPEAPITPAFDDVAVRIRRGRDRLAVVALGGNLGDSDELVATLASAVHRLAELPSSRLLGVSRLVASAALPTPWGPQPDFLNAVALLRTDLHPLTLLRLLHEIEADHGRVRTLRWGSRTLDLDLVDVADPAEPTEANEANEATEATEGPGPLAAVRGRGRSWVRESGPVVLPHPGAGERPFVRWPWWAVEPAAFAGQGESAAFAGQGGHDASGAPQEQDAPAPPEPTGLRPGPEWPASVARWVRGPRVPASPAPEAAATDGADV